MLYVATGPAPDPHADAAWAQRVAAHRSRRPAWWRTVETTDVAAVLAKADGAVLFDCVGTWLAHVMGECGMWADEVPADAEQRLEERIDALVAAWRTSAAYVVAVTNEVGSGVVPPTVSGGCSGLAGPGEPEAGRRVGGGRAGHGRRVLSLS